MSEKVQSASASFTARPGVATRGALAVFSLFFLFVMVMAFCVPLRQQVAHDSSARVGQAALAGFFGLFILGNIAAFLWHCLVKIEATEAGVRWRDLRGWHQADWDDIADFYLEGKQTPWLWLTTRDGRKVALERYWHNRESLQKAVIGRVGERLGVREWALRGTRDIDLPRTFGYDPRAIRRVQVLNFFPVALIAGICLSALMIPTKPGERPVMEDPFLLIMAGLCVAAMLALGIYETAGARIPKERLRERFTARSDGFVFDDGREATFVPWESVTGFDFNPTQMVRRSGRAMRNRKPSRVRTDCGQEFSFYASLDKSSHWEAITRRCAVHGIESKIDGERGEALGGIAARWSGGVEGEGERVFSAWTRSTRMVCVWFPVAIGIAVFMGPVTTFLLVHDPIHPLAFVLLAAMIAVAATIEGLLKSVRIQVGKDAISYLRPWKRETLMWNEIERMEQDGYVVMLYRADGSRLRFDTAPLAYGSQIAPLIDERLRDARAAAGIVNATTELSAVDK